MRLKMEKFPHGLISRKEILKDFYFLKSPIISQQMKNNFKKKNNWKKEIESES
jgi:hypothetical protein